MDGNPIKQKLLIILLLHVMLHVCAATVTSFCSFNWCLLSPFTDVSFPISTCFCITTNFSPQVYWTLVNWKLFYYCMRVFFIDAKTWKTHCLKICFSHKDRKISWKTNDKKRWKIILLQSSINHNSVYIYSFCNHY